MERVGIGRLNGEGSLVARERFILSVDLLLKNAEVEPRVRKIGVARERLQIGDFRRPLAPKLVENVAEIERNDRVDLVELGGEIVKPLGQFKIPLLLVFLGSCKDLVGVDVRAFERKEQLTVGLRGFFKPASQIRAVTYEGLVNVVDAAKAAAFTGQFVLVSGMGSELPYFTGRLLNAIKGDLQRNQRDRDAYLRNSGLDWSIGRGGILTDEPGGRANIRITPPVHRLSLLRRLARADFARALIASADAPAASARTFDVFNEPGVPPTDTELAERLEQLT